MRHNGKGDSVKEIAAFWKDVSIDEIHQRVIAWKTARLANAKKQTPKVFSRRHSVTSAKSFSRRVTPKIPSFAEGLIKRGLVL